VNNLIDALPVARVMEFETRFRENQPPYAMAVREAVDFIVEQAVAMRQSNPEEAARIMSIANRLIRARLRMSETQLLLEVLIERLGDSVDPTERGSGSVKGERRSAYDWHSYAI